ncbi:esterase-like activity of phytase family protein [candidate division KSB1 bacterium]|nr:esterase-like activity of phytase family protein [candidate division KSB1 bacterium]
MKKFLMSILFFLSGIQFVIASNGINYPQLSQNVRFCVFSDPHYHDASLGTSGAAFQKYLAADRKMLAESEAILKAAIQHILQQKPDFVLVPGDLTKDGEKINHEKIATYLAQLETNGIPVYVIPGNHDISNGHAFQYTDTTTTPVPSVTPEEFAGIYSNFGYKDAIARDPNSLSYIIEPAKGIWLFALDPCRYRENTPGHPQTGGKFSAETLLWIEMQLLEAKMMNKLAIGMMHHGILEHYRGQKLFFAEYVLDDYQAVAEKFARLGLRLVFTGHYHAQDVTMQEFGNGSKIYDVETGSLVTFPSPVRTVEITPDLQVDITTYSIPSINYDTQGLSFPDYAKAYLLEGLNTIAMVTLRAPKEYGGYGLPQEQAKLVAPLVVDAFKAHYTGDEIPSPLVQGTIANFLASGDENLILMGQFLGMLWTDLNPGDNDVLIDIKPASVMLASRKILMNWNGVDVFNGGFGSAMALDPNHADHFYFLTDRGPNVDGQVLNNKIFPNPNFAPMVGKFRLDNDSLKLVSTIELKDARGNLITGLPNLKGEGGTGEIAIDLNGNELGNDSLGVDPEGLVVLPDGSFWICDEYGPHIIHFDAQGKTIERLNPFTKSSRALPKVFARRRTNRGMEGLTITPDGKTLVGLMQSPLFNPAKDSVAKSLVTRILTFNIENGEKHEYVYLLENTACANSEIVAVTDSIFLVIERDMYFRYGNPPAKDKYIVRINIAKATDIYDPENKISGLLFAGKTVEQLGDSTQLAIYGIQPVEKEILVNLLDLNYVQDKPEGVVVINPYLIAVVNDDDFGILGNGQNGIKAKIVPTQDSTMNFIDQNIVTFISLDKPLYLQPTGIAEKSNRPIADFALQQNYPNPFNPMTSISYSLPYNSQVKLTVYNILGNEIATLVNEYKKAGDYKIQFDASQFTTGLYFYRLEAGKMHFVRKMLLVK